MTGEAKKHQNECVSREGGIIVQQKKSLQLFKQMARFPGSETQVRKIVFLLAWTMVELQREGEICLKKCNFSSKISFHCLCFPSNKLIGVMMSMLMLMLMLMLLMTMMLMMMIKVLVNLAVLSSLLAIHFNEGS